MRETITQVEETILEAVKKVRVSETIPFAETPSDKSSGQDQDTALKSSIDAAELFTFFTADIIKKNVLFTR